jgi:restriction endonuclease S subunit
MVKTEKIPDGYRATETGILPVDWQVKRLSEVATELTERAGQDKYETVSISAGIGFVNQAEKFGKELSGKQYEKYIVLHQGDFSYNKGNSKTSPQGCIYCLNDRETAAVPNVFESFRVEGQNAGYYEQLFLSGFLNKQLYSKINRGVRDDGLLNLTGKDFYSCTVPVPPIAEQKKIAEVLSCCDRVIELKQQLIIELQQLKNGFLQAMFPAKGHSEPDIRFPEFSDAWEQRKFGEITELKSASRVHKDEWTSNGVPFYRSSDVMAAINGTENEKAFISEELYEKLSKVSGKLEEGDILVTGGGSVGNPYIVPDNKPLYTKDADLLWIKNKGKFHPYFLYEFFFSPTFRNYLGSISHVGTIAHYTITQLSDTPICLPSFEEQKEVGEYFQSLDHLITLHQRELEETKKKKKSLAKLLLTGSVRVPT